MIIIINSDWNVPICAMLRTGGDTLCREVGGVE